MEFLIVPIITIVKILQHNRLIGLLLSLTFVVSNIILDDAQTNNYS